MTLNYRSNKYMELSPAERKEYDLKMSKRPPITELQKLAQKENYALFQLAAMKSNLNHLRQCPSILPVAINTLQANIETIINEIKCMQRIRKNNRIWS